jgi:hypothetical protein
MRAVTKMVPKVRYVRESEYKRVVAQSKLLQKALKKYGQHDMRCLINHGIRSGRGHRDWNCICGLAEAITAPSGLPEAK